MQEAFAQRLVQRAKPIDLTGDNEAPMREDRIAVRQAIAAADDYGAVPRRDDRRSAASNQGLPQGQGIDGVVTQADSTIEDFYAQMRDEDTVDDVNSYGAGSPEDDQRPATLGRFDLTFQPSTPQHQGNNGLVTTWRCRLR